MKALSILLLASCLTPRVHAQHTATGEAYELVVTPARTTIVADGKDTTPIRITAVDQLGHKVLVANNLVRFIVNGDAKILGRSKDFHSSPDHTEQRLRDGECEILFQAGTTIDKVKFEAQSDGLQTGSTGIHTIHPGKPHTIAASGQVGVKPSIDRMIGADISFLPQLEERGLKFTDRGVEQDPILILKNHGFNYVRLRIFNHPEFEGGYSPGKGFCDLKHTLSMAARVKAAGMKLLLDFHYSDYWADPEKQFKPVMWKGLAFSLLCDSVNSYTRRVIESLKNQGTTPDMVQIGNEINHGMIWPEGHIGNLDSLAQLVQAGINGVKSVAPAVPIMLHIALGGQQEETAFFLDNMLVRKVHFDVIGMSYYPKWHGTLNELKENLTKMAGHYEQDIIVVEYSPLKRDVHDIVFNLPGNKGKGTCIWEPLNTWESVFDKQGRSNEFLELYDSFNKEFVAPDVTRAK